MRQWQYQASPDILYGTTTAPVVVVDGFEGWFPDTVTAKRNNRQNVQSGPDFFFKPPAPPVLAPMGWEGWFPDSAVSKRSERQAVQPRSDFRLVPPPPTAPNGWDGQYPHRATLNYSTRQNNKSTDNIFGFPVPLPPAPIDPQWANLPTTVNPLVFLMTNVLRNNALIVVLNANSFGTNALINNEPEGFRQIVPPPSTLIIIVQVAVSDTILMDGSSNLPNYTETLTSGFTAPNPQIEADPYYVSSFVGTEHLSFSLIPG